MAILAGGNPAGSGGTAGIGKGLNIVGDYCYANSGEIANAATGAADSTMFNFNTGSYTAIVKIYFATNVNQDTNVLAEATLEGESIYSTLWDATPTGKASGGPFLELVIPPYSSFQFAWGCGASKTATAVLTGRLYF